MKSLFHVPAISALILLAAGGFFLLNRADEQARDTVRKHHVADLEQALFFARSTQQTFPPYDQSSWCGLLNVPENRPVRDQVEQVLRQQNNKYANPEKPFPSDPSADQDYFYWKRSPAVFELYAVLEQDDTNERSTQLCDTSPGLLFDYGVTSRWRENLPNFTS